MSEPATGLVLASTLDQQGAWSLADRLGDRVGLEGVLGDLRHTGRPGRLTGTTGAHGFGWDRRDGRTREWWPQGITTTADTGARPLVGSRRVLLAAWYRRHGGKNDLAVRVSVVDLGTTGQVPERPAYEHVLLVETERDPVSHGVHHRQVRLHAGGLVWWDEHRLLVADTRGGLRVFDLRDLVRVAPGTPDTNGCRYLLPQCGRLVADADEGVAPLRWSFLSLDRTDADGLGLVAGEYSKTGTGARLARFRLPDPGSWAGPVRSLEVVRTDISSMQGACRVRSTYLVSASHGSWHRGHLWVGSPKVGFTRHPGLLPPGPEDLTYDRHTNRLWTQTEYPGRRVVLSVPLPRPG